MPEYINYYPTSDIIVFPSSNSYDEGKLTLEENIRDIVTRITNRNYALPSGNYSKDGNEVDSFNVTSESDKIKIDIGSANINGYKVVTNNPIYIDPPTVGTTPIELGMILTYDGSDHVRGDKTDGATTIFEGVWIGYLSEYPYEYNKRDSLMIAILDYNGSNIVITRNPEIDHRIDANEVSVTIPGPKPPQQIINLQQYINKMPDWYVSKYGDSICGDQYGDGELKFYKLPDSSRPSLTLTQGNISDTELGGEVISTAYNSSNTVTTKLSSAITGRSGISFNMIGTTISDGFIGYTVGNSELFELSADSAAINMRSGQIDINSNNGKKIVLSSKNGTLNDLFLELLPNRISIDNNASPFSTGAFSWAIDNDGGEVKYKVGNLTIKNHNPNSSYAESTIDNGNIRININPGIITNDIFTDRIITNKSGYYNNSNYIDIDEKLSKYHNGKLTTSIDGTGIITNELTIKQVGSSFAYGGIEASTSGTKSSLTILSTRSDTNSTPTTSELIFRYKEGPATKSITISPVSCNSNDSGTTALKISGNLYVDNNIRASKVYNAVYNDYAEWYERDDLSEVIEPGDVIEMNPSTGKYRKATISMSKMVVGVCSDSYGHILGGDELGDMEDNNKKYIPVGIAGRVMVKVSGTVRIGDILVSAGNGLAKALDDYYVPGIVIGKALSNSGVTGMVRMQIMLG